ncbi:MAG: hypothetical protein ACN6RF_00350, partial [Stenotrophomonas sp.]
MRGCVFFRRRAATHGVALPPWRRIPWRHGKTPTAAGPHRPPWGLPLRLGQRLLQVRQQVVDVL